MFPIRSNSFDFKEKEEVQDETDALYEKLNKMLLDSLSKKDPEGIKNAIDQIDKKIPSEKIPEEDKKLHEKARALLEKLKNKGGIFSWYLAKG